MGTGELITATATYTNNTSEFSQGMVATLSTGNSAPSDIDVTTTTDGGLSINSDGGNDVYLKADDGAAILGGRTSLSLEFRGRLTGGVGFNTFARMRPPQTITNSHCIPRTLARSRFKSATS
ncbi:MAG: hypothetical protein R3C03_13200 [Pirellulaceae bacterium]